jgi:AraC family transcriptional regulator
MSSLALAKAPTSALPVPFAPSDPRIVTLQAGGVIVRHQPPGPFDLVYEGTRPVLLFSFGAVGAGGSGPACRADSFALLRPGRPQDLSHPDPVEVLAVAFPPGALPPSADAAPFDVVDPGVRALAHEIRRVLMQERAPDRSYLEALGQAMLVRAVHALDHHDPGERAVIAPFKLRRVVEHIEANLADKITVADLADLSELSTAYFARLFHQATGESPHHFILSRRIARVQELLADPALDLATVAYRAGFSSHAHMTTAFKRTLGVSPAAYRTGLAA